MTTTTTSADDSGSATLQLLAQQAAALVELERTIAMLADRVETSVGTARGAGDRITMFDLRDKAVAAMTTNTKRTYEGYMDLLVDGDPTLTCSDGRQWLGLGSMWADEVVASDLEKALSVVATRAKRRAEDRAAQREAAGRTVRTSDGRGALYNAIGAWRRLFEVAIKDRHLAEGMNPAKKLAKPARAKDGGRDALEPQHFSAMVQLLSGTGDDPELDALIVRFLDITGARQEGVLELTVGDVDESECTVRLHEKFRTKVDQPVPDWFIVVLLDFAKRRGATNRTDMVFRKRLDGGRFKNISPRRFNYMFCDRLQSSFVWADRLQVTAHTLRHHSITRVERHAGKAVSVAFARHTPGDVNGIYTKASRQEVARAVVELHGGDHPWLHRAPRPRR